MRWRTTPKGKKNTPSASNAAMQKNPTQPAPFRTKRIALRRKRTCDEKKKSLAGECSSPGSKLLKRLLGVLAAAGDRGAEAGDGGRTSHQGRGDDGTGDDGGADKSRGAAGGEAEESSGRHGGRNWRCRNGLMVDCAEKEKKKLEKLFG